MDVSIKNLLTKEIGTIEKIPLSFEAGKIDEEVVAETPVEGDVKITKLEDRLLCDFDLSLKVKLTCVRCLNKYVLDLPIKFEQSYFISPSRDVENQIVKKDFTIDIFEPIRQEILVRIPMQPICRSGCKGLCPYCGQDLNKAKCRCRNSQEESPFEELGKLK